ncbi:cobyric acid synthase [Solicola sp. PLA-1-18]|uniref:cobyric acid synthase n=1 Tax=Solicola sp. PLA-1-18 TaxID=3380532 RepID=UPI003B7DAB45
MIAGASSDAGKSIVTTALCRVLARRGVSVAPFKAQNMSNNSMVTPGGTEIGRAQWVQAVAARAVPEAAMNPVLLKPGSDRRSHVVVMGEPAGVLESGEYAGGRAALAEAAFAAFDDLRSRFDVVVCEGAGSPAEINLRRWDYVNMGLARHGDVPVLLVADIDRGGVLAQLYGTLALLEPADQALLAAFCVNKFRGDVDLLRPGLDTVEQLTGRPVVGVLPWETGLWLDSEDALDLQSRPVPTGGDRRGRLAAAVVAFPRISNFTDVDALTLEPSVDVTFARDPAALAGADVVVLPGTRATIADLTWMRERGLDRAVLDHAARGGAVLGVCGGCQVLGRRVEDPDGVEGAPGASVEGLGLLDLVTVFGREKVLGLPTGHGLGAPVGGYEIHHGRVTRGPSAEELPGGARSGGVFGTMWHGSLESDEFRRAWLREVAAHVGRDDFAPDPSLRFEDHRQGRVDALADALEEHVDVDALLRLVEQGAPVLPVLRPVLEPPT